DHRGADAPELEPRERRRLEPRLLLGGLRLLLRLRCRGANERGGGSEQEKQREDRPETGAHRSGSLDWAARSAHSAGSTVVVKAGFRRACQARGSGAPPRAVDASIPHAPWMSEPPEYRRTNAIPRLRSASRKAPRSPSDGAWNRPVGSFTSITC